MILCCGEALIDMLPRQSTEGEPSFAPYAGGAIFNSAIALGRLGVPAEFFSGLSSDLFGQQIRDVLAASGVGSRYANLSGRPTTLAFVRLTDGHATYTFYDENTAGRMLTDADLPVLGDDIDAMLFGAISLIPEPCGAAYEALMRREHGKRVTMLDPNIRPGFIQDKKHHLARMERMIAMADIVKLSDEDLGWFGEAGGQEDVAARWLGKGPRLVIVTAGSKGATAYSANHKVSVTPEKVTVVDTVGAGDTFNAGVLASLHEQEALSKISISELSETAIREALSLGARAAAITVSRAGANPPWRRELA
ncbi:carbohydrate kinase [Mesorhizobium sp. CC13]|uniref:carbohydrate kinase family protein n=1 Tax=Mesorhizobium sp. CC13 TaxID=3029194 RepID=UPI00326342B7